MKAEVIGIASTRFEVEPGPTGPPAEVSLSLRPCWKKPPVKMQLSFVYESQNVAYYQVADYGLKGAL